MVTYPKDWKDGLLKDFGCIKMCRRIFQSQTQESGEIPFYKISTFGGHADAFILRKIYEEYKEKYPYPEKGDVLISAAGTIGRTVVFDGKDSYFQDSNIVWLSVDSDIIDRQYLWWFYRCSPWDALEGTTIKRLYNSIILNTEIHLPPLPEQKAIATTLSTFDTHIDNLIALIEKKKAIRDGALADLMSGRTRLAGFSGKWEEFNLGKVLVINRGKRLVRSQLSISSHRKFPVYQNSLTPLGYHDSFNCLAHSTFVIAAGNAGDIGYSCKEFWAADDCYYFEHCDEINQKFLYYVLLSRQTEIYAQTRRTSIPRLSRDILEKMPILLPERSEQQAIADILTSMDTEIQNLETERDKFMQIREGAMDDLLTGRVRLPM